MKKSKTLVVNNKQGDVVTMRSITDKTTGEVREIGNIMVQSTSITGLSKLGRKSKRTAFISLEADVLEYLLDELVDGQPFPIDGKIVINETIVPYVKKDGTFQDAKTRGKGGTVMTFQGDPIYRNSFFSENLDETDILLQADPENVDGDTESDDAKPTVE
jgi:hypothetical protein